MTRGNPIGFGITLVGAAVILVSLFLPLNEPTGPFARIQENTLIQSGGWILCILAVSLAAGAGRAWMKPEGQMWLLPLVITVVIGGWIAVIAGFDGTRTLYPVVDGVPDTSQPGQLAELGVAVYVAGAGVVAAIAGSMMLKFYPTTAASDPLVEQWQRRKCPDCAELIMADAKVCKHCGYRFDKPAVKPAPQSAPPPGLVKVIVNCPLCDAEQRIPKGAPQFRCGQCRETVAAP